MNYKRLTASELIGIPVIYCTATILHFVYDFTGGGTLAILFGAVNESVWEHVKIFAAGYAGWALLELLWIRVDFRRYVVVKVIGLYVLSALIIGFFYAYTAVAGKNILAVDIGSSLCFTAAVQLLCLWLMKKGDRLGELFCPALMLLMLYFLMFFSFTVFPPRIDLFRDPESGMYGIIESCIDRGAVYLDHI